MPQERVQTKDTVKATVCASMAAKGKRYTWKEHGGLRKYCPLFKMTKWSSSVNVETVVNVEEQSENQSGTL